PLAGLIATHDLAPGQIIQRSDAAPPATGGGGRLLSLTLRTAPPVVPGDRVDLLAVIGDPATSLRVTPFMQGLPVRGGTPPTLVLEVKPSQAAALVYASQTLTLVAVSDQGSGGGGENEVGTLSQAQQDAHS